MGWDRGEEHGAGVITAFFFLVDTIPGPNPLG